MGCATDTQLNVTFKPANILQAIIERIRKVFENNAPTSYVIAVIIVVAGLAIVGRRYVDLSIGLKKNKSK